MSAIFCSFVVIGADNSKHPVSVLLSGQPRAGKIGRFTKPGFVLSALTAVLCNILHLDSIYVFPTDVKLIVRFFNSAPFVAKTRSNHPHNYSETKNTHQTTGGTAFVSQAYCGQPVEGRGAYTSIRGSRKMG